MWEKRADAVILMSGSRGTEQVGEAALRQGLLVLPIAATGGAAEKLHRQILRQWSKTPLPGFISVRILQVIYESLIHTPSNSSKNGINKSFSR